MIINKINRKAPNKLYHYTNLNSTLGIIENQELWLSNLYFQNDKNEYELGLDILNQILKIKKSDYINDHKVSVFLSTLDSAIDLLTNQKVFTTSFSEEPDLLSQWRGYGDNCQGARIEFSILENIKEPGIQLLPCIYNEKEQIEYINFIFDRSIQILNKTKEKNIANENDFLEAEKPFKDAINAAGSYFISTSNVACSIIKHKAFEEEKEWRLINFKEDQILYRVKSYYIVPYIKMKIHNLKEYLTEIMLCSSPELNISEKSLKFLLNNKGFSKSVITKSIIPYRL